MFSQKRPKNKDESVYSVIFKTPRDELHNDKDFANEIKADMVNEMLTEWNKLTSNTVKATISE